MLSPMQMRTKGSYHYRTYAGYCTRTMSKKQAFYVLVICSKKISTNFHKNILVQRQQPFTAVRIGLEDSGNENFSFKDIFIARHDIIYIGFRLKLLGNLDLRNAQHWNKLLLLLNPRPFKHYNERKNSVLLITNK